jgi:PBP1b-binding outer membrane lipoprotein LpoB
MLKTKSYLLALTVVFAFTGCSSPNFMSSKASCAGYRHVQYKKKQAKRIAELGLTELDVRLLKSMARVVE